MSHFSRIRSLATLALLAALLGGASGVASAAKAPATTGSDPAEEVIAPPKPIEEVAPQHPKALLDKGVEGEATVIVTVDVRGAAVDPVVEKATHDDFGLAALVAASAWKFEPATRNGVPVELKARIPFQFKIAFEHRLNVELGREVYRELLAPVTPSADLAEAPLPAYVPALVDFYPKALRGSGRSASVSLRFVIDPTGLVTNPRVITASDPAFEEAALRAISSIRFNPVVVDGHPAHVAMMMPLQLTE